MLPEETTEVVALLAGAADERKCNPPPAAGGLLSAPRYAVGSPGGALKLEGGGDLLDATPFVPPSTPIVPNTKPVCGAGGMTPAKGASMAPGSPPVEAPFTLIWSNTYRVEQKSDTFQTAGHGNRGGSSQVRSREHNLYVQRTYTKWCCRSVRCPT